MMKNGVLILVISALVFFSCKKDDKTYTGTTMLEFTENSINKTLSYVQTGYDTLWVTVQLVGVMQSSDIEVVVKALNGDASPVSGQLIVENAKAVIKAGSTSTKVPVLINAANVTEGKSVYLQISDASTLKASENYKQLNLNINKQSFIEFFTGSYKCVEPEYQDATYNTMFYKTSGVDSSVYVKNFLNYAVSGLNTSFMLSKVSSKQIIIQGQVFTDKENKPFWLTGRGTYDVNGSMKVEYVLWDYATRTKKEFTGSVIYTKIK